MLTVLTGFTENLKSMNHPLKITPSLSDNMKARDASASKNMYNYMYGTQQQPVGHLFFRGVLMILMMIIDNVDFDDDVDKDERTAEGSASELVAFQIKLHPQPLLQYILLRYDDDDWVCSARGIVAD